MTNREKIEQSIICNKYECFICRMVSDDLQLHHCVSGHGRRKLADEDGLFVMLCPYDHYILHHKGTHEKELKALAQKSFIEQKKGEGYSESQARGLWVNRYGKFWA